jgi:hypothetical protein
VPNVQEQSIPGLAAKASGRAFTSEGAPFGQRSPNGGPSGSGGLPAPSQPPQDWTAPIRLGARDGMPHQRRPMPPPPLPQAFSASRMGPHAWGRRGGFGRGGPESEGRGHWEEQEGREMYADGYGGAMHSEDFAGRGMHLNGYEGRGMHPEERTGRGMYPDRYGGRGMVPDDRPERGMQPDGFSRPGMPTENHGYPGMHLNGPGGQGMRSDGYGGHRPRSDDYEGRSLQYDGHAGRNMHHDGFVGRGTSRGGRDFGRRFSDGARDGRCDTAKPLQLCYVVVPPGG